MQSGYLYLQLTEVFREIIDDSSVVPTRDTTSADIPEGDSIAYVEPVAAAEDDLKVNFDSSELESLPNVGQLVGLIEYRLETLGAIPSEDRFA